MAAYDPRYSASMSGMGVSQDSLYTDYLRDMYEAVSEASSDLGFQQWDRQWNVNYADGPASGMIPGFRSSKDPLQLDPDPFGTETEALAAKYPSAGMTGDGVFALDVFGKRMTRDQLMQSDAGRKLVDIAEKARSGRRRGFLEAITDWSWSDLPFLSLFATVGKSVSDAVTVSDTFKKLQNGEPVTDDELIKTRLYMAEQEYRSDGTWGGTVGDIMRAAPGFMLEFVASGGVYSAIRTGLSKLAGKSTSLLLSGATKKLSREAVETGMTRVIKQGLGKGPLASSDATTGALRWFEGYSALAKDEKALKKITDDATETVMQTMLNGKAGINYGLTEMAKDGAVKFTDESLARQIIRNRVSYEIDKAIARNSSEHAIVRGMHQFGQWFQRHASSAILDHGMWGTEEATILQSGFTKARSALADAAGALFVEAPIRGSLMMAPNVFLAKPLLGQVIGQDGRTVSEAELSLRQSAYLTGNEELMDSANSMAMGMNWLEYVSESAGRGFGSLARGVGLWAKGANKAVARGAGAVLAGAETEAAHEGFSIGGALRKMWNKALGSRAEFLRKSFDDKVQVVGEALEAAGQRLDTTTLRGMVMSGRLPDAVPEAVRRIVGDDVDAFIAKTMKEAYEDHGKKLAFGTLGRYMVGDFMVRHNIGPDTMLNMFQRMGYDGMLGEILEERYSDVAKGVLGLNERADRKELRTRVIEGIKGIWPGWEQLTAEAVGFSMPMVTRMAAARLQARITGGGDLYKLRNRLEMYSDMFRSPVTFRGQLGEFLAVRQMSSDASNRRIADINTRLEGARNGGDPAAIAALEDELSVAQRTAKRYGDASQKWFAGMREASTLRYGRQIEEATAREDAAEVARLTAERDAADAAYRRWEGGDYTVQDAASEIVDQLVVVEPLAPSMAGTEGVEFTMRPANESEQSARSLDAAEGFVDYAPELAKVLFQLDAPLEGESKSWLRTVASKLTGIAGAVISGDFSLVSQDPATWVARDMGIGIGFLKALKSGFSESRKEARRQLQAEAQRAAADQVARNMEDENIPDGSQVMTRGRSRLSSAIVSEEAVDAKAQELFAPRAQRLARDYLVSQQIRTFSRGEMRDRAMVYTAQHLSDADGGAYGAVDFKERKFLRLREDGTIDDSSAIGFDEFYEKYAKDSFDSDGRLARKGIDSCTRDIATATLDILTNRTNLTYEGRKLAANAVQLPDDSDLYNLATYNMAMALSGMTGMIATEHIRRDRSLDQTVKDSSVMHIPAAVTQAIARQALNPDGTWDVSRVDPRLLETVAYTFGFRFDGTAEGLTARNRRAVEIAVLSEEARTPGVEYFRLYEDPRTADTRVSDGAYVLFRARWDGSQWVASETFSQSGDADLIRAGTLEELQRKLEDVQLPGGKTMLVQRTDGRVIFTQKRIFETDDIVDALRILGLLGRYRDMTLGNAHPMFAKGADGNYIYKDEDEAQKAFDDLVELASRTDGEHLVRPTDDATTGDAFRKQEAAALAAWKKLYGDEGIVTVGERLLRDVGVDVSNTVNMATGYAVGGGRYQVRLTQFMGRDGNFYVPVDVNSDASYKDALVHSLLMQAYARNPQFLKNACDEGVGRFLGELKALCSVKVREARKNGNTQLESDLLDMTRGLLAASDRTTVATDENNGSREITVERTHGMTPGMFAQLAHMLCLYGAEQLSKEGYGAIPRVSAFAAIAEDARELPHYTSFLSCVDFVLGGNGFLGERLALEGATVEAGRGLGRLARMYVNDPKSYRELFSKWAPGGVSFDAFLKRADRQFIDMGRPHFTYTKTDKSPVHGRTPGGRDRPVDYDGLGEFAAQLAEAAGGSFTPNDLGEMFAKLALGSVANVDTDDERTRAERVSAFMEEAEKITNSYDGLTGFVEEYRKASETAKDVQNQLTIAVRKLKDAEADVKADAGKFATLRQNVVDLSARLDELKLGSDQKLKKVIDAVKQALELGGDTGAVVVVGGRGKASRSAFGRKLPTARPKDESNDPAEGNNSPAVMTGTGRELPEIQDNVLYTGASTAPKDVRLADDGLFLEAFLSADEARAAFSVVVNMLISQGNGSFGRNDVEKTIASMFPGLPALDRWQILSVYDDAVVSLEGGAKTWAQIADEGLRWTYEEEDKDENEGADTSSENRASERTAVDELDGKALRTFLKLAQYVAPETAGNFQAFINSVRESVRDSDGSDEFLQTLVNPRAQVGYKVRKTAADGSVTEETVLFKSYNEREAMFHEIVGKEMSGSKFRERVADAVRTKGPRLAFLLTYLAAMAPADRARFSQLIGSAAACDPMKREAAEETDANKDPTMVSEGIRTSRASVAVATATFTPFVGLKRKQARLAGGALAAVSSRLTGQMEAPTTPLVGLSKGVPQDESGGSKRLTPNEYLDIIDANRRAIADAIEAAIVNVLGEDAARGVGIPIVAALRSDATMQFLRRSVGRESDAALNAHRNDNVNVNGLVLKMPFGKLLAPIAEALSWRTFGQGARMEIPLLVTIADTLKQIGNLPGGTVGYEDAAALSVAMFTAGASTRDLGSLPEKSSTVDSPFAAIMTAHAAAQPRTIMRADIDPERSTDESSIAITSRGVIPMLSRWMDSDADNGFVKLVETYFSEEIKAYAKQHGVDDKTAFEQVLARCRQDMVWPDGTRILAKNLSNSYFADEIYTACKRQYAESGKSDAYLVPVYAGDHSSSILLQVPYRVQPEDVLKARSKVQTAYNAAYKKYVAARIAWSRETNVERKARLLERLREAHTAVKTIELTARSDEFPKMYKQAAQAMCDSIGLDLLGDDTKRSALSCLEQAGLSMRGVRIGPDGTPTFGKCTIHITCNFQSRVEARVADPGSNGNEELKGITLLDGYGAERQRQCAKLQGTGTLKCHLMSTGGRDLTFLKSLNVSPSATRGSFIKGDCKQVMLDHLRKFKGYDPGIDSAVLTDLDSYKVGPAMSKWLSVIDENGEKRNLLDYIVAKIDGDASLWTVDEKGVRTLNAGALSNLDEYFKDLKFDEAPRSDGKSLETGAKLSDVLPGIRITEVKGLRGSTIDISYEEPDLTSYSVANVSHDANADLMRTPRNNVVDAITMSAVEAQMLGADASGVLDLVSDWGLAAVTACGSPEMVSALARSSSGVRALTAAHEDPNGIFVRDELFRATWAYMRKQLSIPMGGTDMPLVSAGAGVTVLRDANGAIRYDPRTGRPMISILSDSEMMYDINLGSVLFTPKETEKGAIYEGYVRRLGLSAVNIRHKGFRYGWWMDEKKFASTFFKLKASVTEKGTRFEDEFDAKFGGPEAETVAPVDLTSITDEMLLQKLEEAIVSIRRVELATGEPALDLRRQLTQCFTDHHGMYISEYGDDAISRICFDDLFRQVNGQSGRSFDRSAVQIGEDRVHNLVDEKSHVFLGGTMFGIPRTPSYNGGQWLQVVRASIPVTEVETPSGRFMPGQDAMVAPDPVTSEILGCDHDGDKTKVYWMVPGKDGHVEFAGADILPAFDGELKSFRDDPKAREGYYAKLKAAGFVDEEVDPRTGQVTREVSRRARWAVGNSFVRAIFDMAGNLPVPERLEGVRRQSFLDGPVSVPTSPFPGGKGLKKALLDIVEGKRDKILKGTRLNDPEKAADVTAAANDVANARARIVSYARTLHLAFACGLFRDSLFGADFKYDKWFRFIHYVDCISNATFDDLKEQLCTRLGWTAGMMPVLVADMLRGTAGHPGPVCTQTALEEVLKAYVGSVADYGSRYYMMIASDDADRKGLRPALEGLLGKRYDHLDDGGRWAAYFGVEPIVNDQGVTVGWKRAQGRTDAEIAEHPKSPAEVIVGLIPEALERINEIRRDANLPEMGASDAYGALAFDGRDNAPVHGGLLHLLKEAAGAPSLMPAEICKELDSAVGNDLAPSADRKAKIVDALADYLEWRQKYNQLEGARETCNAFNFLTVDPGADTADERLKKILDFGERLEESNGAGNGYIPKGTLMRMHAATGAAYVFGYGLESVRAKAAHALESLRVDRKVIAAFADQQPPDDPVRRVSQALDALSPMPGGARQRLAREAALLVKQCATIPMFQHIGAKRAMALLTALADGRTDDGATLGALRGAATLYNVMYRLASTSGEFYGERTGDAGALPVKCNAFSFFAERRDSRYPAVEYRVDESTGDRYAVDRYINGDTADNPLYIIQPRFTGDSGAAMDIAQSAVGDVLEGRAFAGGRVRVHDAKTVRTKARSFVLNATNLDGLLAEIEEHPVGTKDDMKAVKSEIEKAKRLAEALMETDPEVKAAGGVTPAFMFGTLLPLYTSIVHRPTGTLTKGGMSLIPYIPGLQETLSRREAANSNGYGQIIASTASVVNTAPIDHQAVKRDAEGKPQERPVIDENGVQVTMALERGGRSNPEHRNIVDVFAEDGFLGTAADRMMVMDKPIGPAPGISVSAPVAPDGTPVSQRTVRAARAIQALTGSWATVRYTGKSSFVIEGTLRGGVTSGAARGKRIAICVSTESQIDIKDDMVARRLADSAEYAASFAATDIARSLGIDTAQKFRELNPEVRLAFVKRYGVGAATMSKPLFTIDSKGAAALVGVVRLDPSAQGTMLYHEYFHAMMNMFHALDVFSVQDIAELRKTFGPPPPGTNMLFNEERAAERFRKFVEEGTAEGLSEGTRGVFHKIFDLIVKLFRTLVGGFSYRDDVADWNGTGFSRNETILFSMVITGVAARSTDKVLESDAAVRGRFFGDTLVNMIGLVPFYENAKDRANAVNTAIAAGKEVGLDITSDNLDAMVDIAHRLVQPSYKMTPIVSDHGNLRPMVESDKVTVQRPDGTQSVEFAEGIRYATRKELLRHGEERSSSAGLITSATPERSGMSQEMSEDESRLAAHLESDAPLDVSMARQVIVASLEARGLRISDEEYTSPNTFVSAVENASPNTDLQFSVKLGVPPVASQREELYMAGLTLAELCAGKARSDLSFDMEALKRAMNTPDASTSDMSAEVFKRTIAGAVRDVLATVNPEALKRFDASKLKEGSLMFDLMLSSVQLIDRRVREDAARNGGRDAVARAFLEAQGDAPDVKWHASRFDVSAWMLFSGGVTPASIVEDARNRVAELARTPGALLQPLSALCDNVLKTVEDAVSSPSAFVSEITGATQAFETALSSVWPGMRSGGIMADGSFADYVINTDIDASKNPVAAENIRRGVFNAIADGADKSSAEYRAAQEMLKTTVPALLRAKAMLKFHRELGFVPASKEDEDFARLLQEQGRATASQTAAQWCAWHAIGDSNLLDNEGLIDFYDQPFFTADNMEAYLASMVRPTFGGERFGAAVQDQGHEYAGIMYDLKDLENYQSHLLGDSMLPGNPILQPILKRHDFTMDSGVVRYTERKGRLVGFDVYNREVCGIALDEDEVRAVDFYKKALAYRMAGWKSVITGLDHLTFRLADAGLTGDGHKLKDQADRMFYEGSQFMSRYLMTMHRIDKQLSEGILENDDPDGSLGRMGFLDRFTQHCYDALQAVAQTYRELRQKAIDGTLSEEERHVYESFDFNGAVIDRLEADGLVVARRKRDGTAYECVVKLDTDELLRWFKGTTAYRKLTSGERWARVEQQWMAAEEGLTAEQAHRRVLDMFEPDALVGPMREQWNRVSRFVREHPWMTQGDARHLTAFGTPLPFFRGTGVFMWNATQAARVEARRNRVESLADNETGWLKGLFRPENRRRLSEPITAIPGDEEARKEWERRLAAGEDVGTSFTERQAEFERQEEAKILTVFRDLVNARDIELVELKRALVEGDLEENGKYWDRVRRFGLELGKDPTLAAIVDETYRLMVVRAELEATGTSPFPRTEYDLQRMIDGYQEALESQGGVTGGLGASPEAMYQSFGTLPANHQLGHMVRVAAEQVTNAMVHRQTFMSLMLTPAYDGAPVYYMRPGDSAAAESGVPDSCWGLIARWWAAFHRLPYDETRSGVQNAQRLYDTLRTGGMIAKGDTRWHLKSGLSDHRYIPLPDANSDLGSVTGIMCMEDEGLGNDSSLINGLAKGEAVGYMRQFVDSGKALGYLAFRKNVHRVMSWSKSMSVAFSLFFPLATRFESPIGAVGAIPTIMGNVKGGARLMRAHPEVFNALQRIFGGSGWITKDFIGFRDNIDMMDSRNPFLSEMVSWVHALGLSYSDDLVNPAEPSKAIVVSDIKKLESMMRRAGWSPKVVRRFRNFADSVLVRPGDRAFRYALNATKLAVVAQLAMKLRHEAQRAGKAFDPIRDLRRLGSYVNAEVGGIDESRYAWAHPAMRGLLKCLFFSWQWTRGAWEAGGGNVIEDFFLGGHSATRQERKYILGRWARMYGEIMIGVPLMMQIAVMAMSRALGGGDDDDDRWFTWQNETKANLSAFDITPLMKALHRHEDVAGMGGRVAGALLGYRRFGWLGAVAGGLIGDRLVPNYTGKDTANWATQARRYYMHFGKQGWEFFRWFDSPGQQFLGKLSMPTQRLLEGFFGRNLTYMDHALPWDGMGPVERWFSPSLDSATVNLVKAFLPFSAGQMMSFGDAGFLPIVGPVQMGASQTAVQKRLEKAIEAWAKNDRTAYSWGAWRHKAKGKDRSNPLAHRFADVLDDARRNGMDPQGQLNTALGTVASRLYGRIFDMLPENVEDDYDARGIDRVARMLNRILTRKSSVMQSMKKKFDARKGHEWDTLPEELRRRYETIVGTHLGNPFAGAQVPPTI